MHDSGASIYREPSGTRVPGLRRIAAAERGLMPGADTSTFTIPFVYVPMQRENVGNKSDRLLGSSNLKLQGCKMQPGLNESR